MPRQEHDATVRHERRQEFPPGAPGEDQNANPAAPEGSDIQDQVRRFSQEVSEQYTLPPLPLAVTRALGLTRDPEVDIDTLARVISNDAALVGRILGMSRSPIYGRRQPPRNLQEAVSVIGLKALQRVLLTAGTHMLCGSHNKLSVALWHHGLVTALAAETLSRQTRRHDKDTAFLAGLMHDVGQMVFMSADLAKFKGLYERAEAHSFDGPTTEWEKEAFGFDHTQIAASILYRWDMDVDICTAILSHHEHPEDHDPQSLESLLWMADYLSYEIDVGFLSKPTRPTQAVLEVFECHNEDTFELRKKQLKEAFEVERNLLSLARS